MSNIQISIIIACYNEGPGFARNIDQIIKSLQKLKKTFELIFVEDFSNDETAITVKTYLSKIKNSKAIFHKKNFGRGRSVTDGLKISRGDISGFLDVDLEISADYISIFIKEVEKGNDLVVGKRFYENNLGSLTRFIASKIYSILVRSIINIPLSDTETGYKFFRTKKILPILKKCKEQGWFWDTEICARSVWANLQVSEIPVLFIRRKDKDSTVKLIPDSIDYLIRLIKFRLQKPNINA